MQLKEGVRNVADRSASDINPEQNGNVAQVLCSMPFSPYGLLHMLLRDNLSFFKKQHQILLRQTQILQILCWRSFSSI